MAKQRDGAGIASTSKKPLKPNLTTAGVKTTKTESDRYPSLFHLADREVFAVA